MGGGSTIGLTRAPRSRYGVAMNAINQALTFVKPHAARNRTALDRIAAVFAAAGVRSVHALPGKWGLLAF